MKNRLREFLKLFSTEKAQGEGLIKGLGREWRDKRQ